MNNLFRKPAELLEIESVLCDQIPVVRRFTGGGTVLVDPGTIFVTFICNKDAVAGVQPYPQPIMSWSGALYNKVFQGIGDFHLRENGNCTLHNTSSIGRELRLYDITSGYSNLIFFFPDDLIGMCYLNCIFFYAYFHDTEVLSLFYCTYWITGYFHGGPGWIHFKGLV